MKWGHLISGGVGQDEVNDKWGKVMPGFQDAEALNVLIGRAHQDWKKGPLFTDPQIKGALVSQIAYALGGANVEYVTVEHNTDLGYVQVLVFAGSRIVRGMHFVNEESPITGILSTGQIERIYIEQSANHLSGASDADDSLKVGLKIEGLDYSLPGDSRATSENVEALEVFFPSLLKRARPTA